MSDIWERGEAPFIKWMKTILVMIIRPVILVCHDVDDDDDDYGGDDNDDDDDDNDDDTGRYSSFRK